MDKSVLKSISYGMYIVTSIYDNFKSGCIINSAIQVTKDVILISLNKKNYTSEIIKKSKKFSINILDKNIDINIIKTFGFYTSKDVDKFKNINYKVNDNYVILNDCIGYICCDVINIIEEDTHNLILGKLTNMEKLNDKEVLTYSYYQRHYKGTTPIYAPTYIENKINNENKKNKNVFVCKVCGYIYETDLEELPIDFVCPVCGVGKEYFIKVE